MDWPQVNVGSLEIDGFGILQALSRVEEQCFLWDYHKITSLHVFDMEFVMFETCCQYVHKLAYVATGIS